LRLTGQAGEVVLFRWLIHCLFIPFILCHLEKKSSFCLVSRVALSA
jgi:hypothetical protein